MMGGIPVRIRSLAIVSLLLAGAAAFACAAPAIEGDEDFGVPLPDRVSSAPKPDASTIDAPITRPPPRDAQVDQEAAPADAGPLRAFVSSAVINGNLAGIAGADQKCNALAATQGLTGVYRAWISVNGTNAADRITSAGPWQLVTGQLVAANRAELLGGQLRRPIDIDEKGGGVPAAEDRVWTGTSANGTFSGPECGLWSGAGDGRVGEAAFSDSRWSSSEVEDCDQSNRLYCFQL
jgi:hypothetical protein